MWNVQYGDETRHMNMRSLIALISVAGCTPYLAKYARDRITAERSALETQMYARALHELSDFMIVDGIESVS